MRVLVTGATGFLGRQAVSALQSAGHHVIGLQREAATSVAQERIEIDLLAPGAAAVAAEAARADALLHLAWTTSHGIYWNDPANQMWSAVSRELVAAMAGRGTRRICAVGTCFEYDWPSNGNCDEFQTNTARHTPYDAAKDGCRRSLSQFSEEENLSFSWARIFHLYGPSEHPDRLVSSISRSLVAEQVAMCSSGQVLRDFMDVRDAGAALAALTVSDVRGPVNIASGNPACVRDIATKLGELANRPDLIRVGALPDRPNDPPRITASVGRLRTEVGFAGRHSLEDGLKDALQFWRNEGKKQ